MKQILKVHSVNDYARYIGAPVLHPLVSVIHYDELEHCRHSLNLMEALRKELERTDGHTQHIITAYLQLILEHIARYYAGQLSMQIQSSSDLLTRFENLLKRYYDEGLQLNRGLPMVKYCAQELFLSTNYFGDLIRQMTDDTAGNIIRRFVMSQAQKLLISGTSITSTANQLGFEYPQHFTRMFKKHFGESPSQYLNRKKK